MTATRRCILVVDDEPAIRRFLRTSLAAQGYRVDRGGDRRGGAGGAARSDRPDLVILDLGLPDIDGLEVIRRSCARAAPVPIIVLSSRGDESGKVAALDLGADDYVTKPFGIDELLARMRAALRHRLQQQGGRAGRSAAAISPSIWCAGSSRVGGEEVKLSPKEYDLLRAARGPCRQGADPPHPAARGLGRRDGDVQYLRIYIRQLRQKIEADPTTPRHILTETGVGYRLV